MLSIIQNYFASGFHPIGVDFGAATLRLAQVQSVDNDHRLIAAASTAAPVDPFQNPADQMDWLSRSLRDLLAQGKFRGREAVLALPAQAVRVIHLRLPAMDPARTIASIPTVLQGRLPYDVHDAYIRHMLVPQVDPEQTQRNDVIVLATPRELVESMIDAARSAHLEVIGLTAPQMAVIDCFNHVYRRQLDQDVTSCFVDMGDSGTRIIIARANQMLHAQSIALGLRGMRDMIASQLRLTSAETNDLLLQMPINELSTLSPKQKRELHAGERDGNVLYEASSPAESRSTQFQLVGEILRKPLKEIGDEILQAIAQFQANHAHLAVNRVIFVGGGAQLRTLCQHIAKQVALSALIGDPMVRMSRISGQLPSFAIDRRQAQPAWAVAIGLSLGARVAQSSEVAA